MAKKRKIKLWAVLPVTLDDVRYQCIMDGSLSVKCLFLSRSLALECRKKSAYPTMLASMVVTEEELPEGLTTNNSVFVKLD